MILGCEEIKKHRVLLDMINNFIIFFLKYYSYFRIPLLPILSKSEKTKTRVQARQSDIILNHILKKVSNENLDGFLKTIQKTLSKNKWLINASKQKQSLNKQKPETIIIHSLDKSDITELLILIQISRLDTKINVTIIDTDTYHTTCKLYGAQVFILFIKDLE